MPELTAEFIQAALDEYRVWDLGNDVLYALCADHPGHTAADAIIAKMWLIGRSYAAAAERRHIEDNLSGDEFYTKSLAPTIINKKIDLWFQELKCDKTNSRELNLRTHKKMVELLKELTGHNKRSLASKYLHFHFPGRFFIYDNRSSTSVWQVLARGRKHEIPAQLANVDKDYQKFFSGCEQLSLCIRGLIGKSPTPREVDKVLLHWSSLTAAR
jgi:hypothetical protein